MRSQKTKKCIRLKAVKKCFFDLKILCCRDLFPLGSDVWGAKSMTPLMTRNNQLMSRWFFFRAEKMEKGRFIEGDIVHEQKKPGRKRWKCESRPYLFLAVASLGNLYPKINFSKKYVFWRVDGAKSLETWKKIVSQKPDTLDLTPWIYEGLVLGIPDPKYVSGHPGAGRNLSRYPPYILALTSTTSNEQRFAI